MIISLILENCQTFLSTAKMKTFGQFFLMKNGTAELLAIIGAS